MPSTFMIDVALQFYARQGLAVFPCRAKKPLCKNGLKDATTNEATIREWWTRWPDAQVGVPTGARNHLLVADSDGPKGNDWIRDQNWPQTLTVETSPDHFQLYFRQPEGILTKNSASKIAPQVDVRGDGGYVIGAYSFHHKTGKPYLIVRSVSGERRTDNPILPWADAPPSLLSLVKANSTAPTVSGEPDTIPQGRRHATMLALAGSFRARGFSPETVLGNLRVVNEHQCNPPLPDDELQKLALYVGSKPAGFRNQKSVETCSEVEIENFSRVEMEKIRWQWSNRIASGKLNLFVGDPDKGKSLVSIDAAARITTGSAWPDGAPCERGEVLIVSCEDGASDTIAPRLLRAGADLSRVHRIKSVKVTLPDGQAGESFFNLERDLEKLEKALEKIPNIKLIIIDPISAYMGKIKTFVDTEVRVVLGPLADLANKRKIAVLGIMHLRKGDAAAMLRVSGSIAYVAAARVVWGFGIDPAVPDRHVMIAVKNNLGPKAPALAYNIISSPDDSAVGVIRWLVEDQVTLTADEVLDNNPRRNRATYGNAQNNAEAWLRNLLSSGPVPQQRIEAEAESENFSWATVRRAKNALRAKSTKASMGGGWLWALPESEGAQ